MLRQTRFIFSVLSLLLAAQANASPDLVEQGRRIYQNGILPDGSALTAGAAGASALSGKQAACVRCHRRSGFGSREGTLPIAPVNGLALFTKPEAHWSVRKGRQAPKINPLRQDSREAYDEVSLARAIRGGIDSSGRPLGALMPRYNLDEPALQALNAYLHQLSAAATPGVVVTGVVQPTLHLATIITPDADPVRAQTVVDALNAWVNQGGLSRVTTVLQVWRLEGPEAGWDEQLQRFYRQQPVFSALSGAGASKWRAVRDFCEQTATPCLFPIVDLAPSDADDYYSFYFSNGVPLEARMLVKYLQDQPMPVARVIQIVADEAGEAAAALVAAGESGSRIETRRWQANLPELLADLQAGDVLVAWLRPEPLRNLFEALPQVPKLQQLLLSAQLAPPEQITLPDAWRPASRWISVHPDPRALHGKAVIGLVPWATRYKLSLEHEALLAQVYAATYFFNDALARTRGRWNRDYLAEVMETAVDNRFAGAAFYGLSLGPEQRVAAKGGHLLGYAAPDYKQIIPLSARIVP